MIRPEEIKIEVAREVSSPHSVKLFSIDQTLRKQQLVNTFASKKPTQIIYSENFFRPSVPGICFMSAAHDGMLRYFAGTND